MFERVVVAVIFINLYLVNGNHLVLKDIKLCENYKPEGKVKAEVNVTTNGTEVSLTGFLELPFDVDEHILYKITVFMWSEEQNTWGQLLDVSGRACDGILVVPHLWHKIAHAAKVNTTCPIKKGHYAVKDFVLDAKDAELPFKVMGMLKAKIHLVNKDMKSVICREFHIVGTDE